MNKKVLFFAFCVFAHIYAFSQATIKNIDGPVIVFEEISFDFDTIISKDTVMHYFKFMNNGNEPLIISKSYTSCGCTIPIWPQKPINPGESDCIIVGFHAHNVGRFSKGTMVVSNAINSPNQMLRINGFVKN